MSTEILHFLSPWLLLDKKDGYVSSTYKLRLSLPWKTKLTFLLRYSLTREAVMETICESPMLIDCNKRSGCGKLQVIPT